MAPKKGTKRTDQRSSAPAAKKPKADPNIAGVVEALEQATGLPGGCRKMLLACIPHCFGASCDERHACQEEAVKMIGEVIQGVEATLQNAAADESNKVAEVEASKALLQQALTEAETVASAAAEDVSAKTAKLAKVAEAVQAATASVQRAEEAQRAGDAELLQVQQRKDAMERGIETDLQAIVDGQGDPEQHLQALLPLLSGLGLDESLMSALPSTCKKVAADRGSFDAMVLEQLGVRLREQAALLTKAVEEANKVAQERASAMGVAQGELSKATEERTQAEEDLKRAQAGQRSALDGTEAAEKKLADFEPQYAKATQDRDEKAAALDNFRMYNVGCFEQLRNQASAKVAGAGA